MVYIDSIKVKNVLAETCLRVEQLIKSMEQALQSKPTKMRQELQYMRNEVKEIEICLTALQQHMLPVLKRMISQQNTSDMHMFHLSLD